MQNVPIQTPLPSTARELRVYMVGQHRGKISAYVAHYTNTDARKLAASVRAAGYKSNTTAYSCYWRPDLVHLLEYVEAPCVLKEVPETVQRYHLDNDQSPGESGCVYLVHLSEPLEHARHYVGWTSLPVDERMRRHRLGEGSKMLRAAVRKGIKLELVRVWPRKSRNFERRIKNRKGAACLCPVCKEECGG